MASALVLAGEATRAELDALLGVFHPVTRWACPNWPWRTRCGPTTA
ncbi:MULTISPECIES: hypothetical protein [Lentzea]|nr:hypothetical protein [Lentzea atacamensis]